MENDCISALARLSKAKGLRYLFRELIIIPCAKAFKKGFFHGGIRFEFWQRHLFPHAGIREAL
jgi:hypothetical protein